MKKLLSVLCFVITILSFAHNGQVKASAEAVPEAKVDEGAQTFVVYFTGVGCPHCAQVDPVLLQEWTEKYPDLVVVEYEIYQQGENGRLLYDYDEHYGTGLGIPLIVFNQDESIIGDGPILEEFEGVLKHNQDNPLPLRDGTSSGAGELRLGGLPLYPKLWQKDRIAIKDGSCSSEYDNQILDFLAGGDMEIIFNDEPFVVTEPERVALSGSEIEFENAIKLDGWVLQWDGEPIDPNIAGEATVKKPESEDRDSGNEEEMPTLLKTISLGAIDAINPCALAVLTMMLISIITYNPKNKKNILLAGLAFTASVFVMYMIYGLVIIRFFKLVQAITSVRLVLYKVLAVAAFVLGVLQIKDFICYKSGSLGTEMPMFMRPKVKKIIAGITSPRGAFLVGLFVTLFLLPCTIGPYLILGGMLSVSETLSTVPYLLVYNVIFVLPMLVITAGVYFGLSKAEDVSEWKDKNIRLLHLISGVVIAGLGVAMFFGWA